MPLGGPRVHAPPDPQIVFHPFFHNSSESSLHASVARGHRLFLSISCRCLKKSCCGVHISQHIPNKWGRGWDSFERLALGMSMKIILRLVVWKQTEGWHFLYSVAQINIYFAAIFQRNVLWWLIMT